GVRPGRHPRREVQGAKLGNRAARLGTRPVEQRLVAREQRVGRHRSSSAPAQSWRSRTSGQTRAATRSFAQRRRGYPAARRFPRSMSARTLFVATGLVLAVALVIPATAARAEAKPNTDDEKTIYVLGYSLAGRLGPFQGLSGSELDALLAGLRDAMTNAKPQVDPDQFGPKIAPLAQARSSKMAEQEKAASMDFLAKAAAEKGATKSPTGLIKRVIKEGSGPTPTENDTVKVNYHGTLRDGSVFDSSVERGEPATFPANKVIPCW